MKHFRSVTYTYMKSRCSSQPTKQGTFWHLLTSWWHQAIWSFTLPVGRATGPVFPWDSNMPPCPWNLLSASLHLLVSCYSLCPSSVLPSKRECPQPLIKLGVPHARGSLSWTCVSFVAHITISKCLPCSNIKAPWE